ncbi:hypothetical protein BLOT_008504 [Blomia tropicalis]|nr:hypothetical protein BLOT_008504 [Blomia tropicalis]
MKTLSSTHLVFACVQQSNVQSSLIMFVFPRNGSKKTTRTEQGWNCNNTNDEQMNKFNLGTPQSFKMIILLDNKFMANCNIF